MTNKNNIRNLQSRLGTNVVGSDCLVSAFLLNPIFQPFIVMLEMIPKRSIVDITRTRYSENVSNRCNLIACPK